MGSVAVRSAATNTSLSLQGNEWERAATGERSESETCRRLPAVWCECPNLLTCPTVLGATKNQIVARVAHRRQPSEARFADGQAGTASHLDGANGVKRMSVSMAVSGDTPLRVRKRLGLA